MGLEIIPISNIRIRGLKVGNDVRPECVLALPLIRWPLVLDLPGDFGGRSPMTFVKPGEFTCDELQQRVPKLLKL